MRSGITLAGTGTGMGTSRTLHLCAQSSAVLRRSGCAVQSWERAWEPVRCARTRQCHQSLMMHDNTRMSGGRPSETNCHHNRSRSQPIRVRPEPEPGRYKPRTSQSRLKTQLNLRLISVYKSSRFLLQQPSIIFKARDTILHLCREFIKFSVYFLCQGVISKDDDDCRRECFEERMCDCQR